MQTPTEPTFANWIDSRAKARERSPELGHLDYVEKIEPSINKRTGRPIRKSAGRKSIAAGFVNWVDAVENGPNEPWNVHSDASEELNNSDQERPKKKLKTKRAPSPPLPPLSPMLQDAYPTPGSSPPPEAPSQVIPTFTAPLTLAINIPPNFQGGTLNINVDVAALMQQTNQIAHFDTQPKRFVTTTPKDNSVVGATTQKKGFLSLPGELRNKIYRLTFVKPETIEFNGKTWCRSGAFLATCRTVYNGGRGILYGENRFLLERTNKTRGNYFDSVHKEVGYKDVRRFFESIGPGNIALMRDISITFDDAMPSMTPYLSNNEERRFTYDLHLIAVLKLLGRHSKLETLTMAFQGRRTLMLIDYHFLDALKTIKADDVKIVGNAKTSGNHYYWNPHPKITPQLKIELIKELSRANRLYPYRK